MAHPSRSTLRERGCKDWVGQCEQGAISGAKLEDAPACCCGDRKLKPPLTRKRCLMADLPIRNVPHAGSSWHFGVVQRKRGG